MTEAGEWRGRVGGVWAVEWARTDLAFAGIAAALDTAIERALRAAGLTGPRVFDVGCGAGATSLALARTRSDADMTGVDLSPDLVAVATTRLADRPDLADRVRFLVGDAPTEAAAHAPFDVIVSRHGVMFFPDPPAAFAQLHAAAGPGAPLVFSCFRDRVENPWGGGAVRAVTQNMPPPPGAGSGPFAFADPDRVAAILAAAGWRDAVPHAVDTIFRVGNGHDPVAAAVDFFSRIGSAAAALRDLPEADRPAARVRLAEFAAGYRAGDAIDFPAAIWIWTARA